MGPTQGLAVGVKMYSSIVIKRRHKCGFYGRKPLLSKRNMKVGSKLSRENRNLRNNVLWTDDYKSSLNTRTKDMFPGKETSHKL